MKTQIEPKTLAAKVEDILREITKHRHYKSVESRKETIGKKPVNVILLDFISRFQSHLNVIGIVLSVAEEKDLFAVEHSIGISLRSCLLDCLTMGEVIHLMDELDAHFSPEKQREVYLTINTDQIKFLMKRLDSLKKLQGNGKSQIKLNFDPDILIKGILNDYAEYFEDATHRKFKYDKKRGILDSAIWIGQSVRFKHDAALILELWEHYSRYEHYGPLSYELQQISKEENWNRMVWGLIFVTHFLAYIFGFFDQTKETSSFLTSKIDDLAKLQVAKL